MDISPSDAKTCKSQSRDLRLQLTVREKLRLTI